MTLVDYTELVARVARRFMPRLKILSEVATLRYLRENTPVPVPTVYHYDCNPYNRLGGEYILMSKVCTGDLWRRDRRGFIPRYSYTGPRRTTFKSLPFHVTRRTRWPP